MQPLTDLDGPRALLAALAALLALLGGQLSERARRVLLLVSLATAAAMGSSALTSPADTYDAVHHYLGARYFDEVGYDGLYPALLAADAERQLHLFEEARRVRLRDERLLPVASASLLGEELRERRFTPERWQRFGDDLEQLAARPLPPTSWARLLTDHGLNAPPGWLLLGGNLARLTPPEHLDLLGRLDLLLLLGALVLVGRTLGAEVAAWVALYLLVAYTTRWPGLGRGVLRYDYVAALLISVALAHQQRDRLAGAFLGLAAALRYFPALWLLPLLGVASGPGARGARRLIGATALSAALLLGLSALQRGPAVLPDSLHHLALHSAPEHSTSRRVGLATALASWSERGTPTLTSAHRSARAQRGPLALGLGLGLAAALIARQRHQRSTADALEVGPAALFLLTSPSYYYWAVCSVLALRHARRREWILLGTLLALEASASAMAWTLPQSPRLQGSLLSIGLTFYLLAVIATPASAGRTPDPDKKVSLPKTA